MLYALNKLLNKLHVISISNICSFLFKLYKTIAFKATMPSCKLQEDRKLEKNNRVETSLQTKENQISMLITVMHNHHNTAKRVS